MKSILTILYFFLSAVAFAQSDFPDFLQGTWKVENKEMYEHWDKLNENSLKGFSYTIESGEMTVCLVLLILYFCLLKKFILCPSPGNTKNPKK